MRTLARIGVALALAQRVAIGPARERYENAEHRVRVGKALRRTRPGR